MVHGPQFLQLLAGCTCKPLQDSSPSPSAGTEIYKAASPFSVALSVCQKSSLPGAGVRSYCVYTATRHLHGTFGLSAQIALCKIKNPRNGCESNSASVLGTQGTVACNKCSEQAVGSEPLLAIVGKQKGNKVQIQIKDASYRL